MGLFSGLFGGGGSAKRAAAVAAAGAAEARETLGEQQERYGAYYDPYRQAGEAALGQQQAVLGDVSGRISALDPRIADLRQQQAALQPQVSEMYTLAQQQDPILAQITSGDLSAYQQTPGYEFRRGEGLRALEQSAAARGGLFAGQTGKELERYGQGFATNEYDEYLRRLYNQLGAVGTQLGGRQAALGAGQEQVRGGVALLDQDYRQIAAQMGLSSQYQNLISKGASAADAAARLGMDTASKQAGLTKGIGETYASGMQAKAAQMGAAGDQWLNLGATALGFGQPFSTAGAGQQQFGGQPSLGGFGQAFSQAYGAARQPQMGAGAQGTYGPAQKWQNPDLMADPQRQAALRFSSSFNRGLA